MSVRVRKRGVQAARLNFWIAFVRSVGGKIGKILYGFDTDGMDPPFHPMIPQMHGR